MGNEASSCEEEPTVSARKEKADRKMSNAEIRLVRQLWTEARRKGPDEPGRSILSSVFIKDPRISRIADTVGAKDLKLEVKLEVPSPSHSSPRARTPLRYDFSHHARQFTLGMDTIIENLHNPQFVEDYLQKLGRKHALLINEAVPANMWDTFGGSMIEKTFEWGSWKQRSAISQKAWGSVVQLIVEHMKIGFYLETKRLSSVSISHSVGSFRKMSPTPTGNSLMVASISKSASAADVSIFGN